MKNQRNKIKLIIISYFSISFIFLLLTHLMYKQNEFILTTRSLYHFLIWITFLIISCIVIYILISRSLRKEEALLQQFKEVWEHSNDGMRITDYNGNIVDVNEAFCKLVEKDKDELIGQSISIYHLSDLANHIKEGYKNFINSDRLEERFEKVLKLWNGKIYHVEVSSSHIKLQNGKKCILSIFHDVTAYRRAEKEKWETLNMLKKITETTHEIITLYDVNTKTNIFQNRSLLITLGYKPEEVEMHTKIPGKCKLVHPDDELLDEIMTKNTENLLDNELLLFEYRIKTPNGEWNWIRRRTSVYSRGVNGKPDKLVNVYTNITDEKTALEKLKQSEEKYRSLVETSPYPITIYNLQGNITFCNKAKAQMFGYEKPEDMIGNNIFRYIHSNYTEQIMPLYQKLVSGEIETAEISDIALVKKDNTIFFAEYNATVLKDIQGKPYAVISIMNDISEKKAAIQALKEREKYLNAIFNAIPDAIFIIDYKGFFKDIHISSKFAPIIQPDKIISSNIKDILSPKDADIILELIHLTLKKNTINKHIYPLIIDNRIKYFEATISLFTTNEILAIVRDITEMKLMEENIKRSEKYYRELFESAHDSIMIFDPVSERILDVNERACNIYGFTKKEFLNLSLSVLSTNMPHSKEMIERVIERGSIENVQTIHINKKKERMLMEINATIIDYKGLKAILTIGRDITAKKHAENQIKASLKEKEVLLKEVHHRVKNNLQVISSLLKLQTEFISNPNDLEIFKESQNRVKAMALIHEKLYRTQNFARLDFTEYIRSLAENLFFTYSIKFERIKLNIQSPKTEFNIETAIPLGLIINELLTNSLKHAFNITDTGAISIELKKTQNDKYRLLFTDNGIGIGKEINIYETKTLGLQLVQTLCAQLNAEINLIPAENTLLTENRKGTCYEIIFEEVKYKER